MTSSILRAYDLIPKVGSSTSYGLSQPYIPSHNESIITAAQNADMGPSPIGNLPDEVLLPILTYLTQPKDLEKASEVCKVFYRISKTQVLWKNQLHFLLPKVCALTADQTSFTPEKQFKIAFKSVALLFRTITL